MNAHRHDPYRTFKFQILIDGKPVAGLKKMGALKRKTEPIKWRAARRPEHRAHPARRHQLRADHPRTGPVARPGVRELGQPGQQRRG
ncbi:MAG: phage tail protein [Comamonadaceae bacterium]|nr:phage tail protein [Comamonadaceae bacterium]